VVREEALIIDVSMTIEPGAVFRRGTPGVEISKQSFHHESEGEFESTMLHLAAHTATHVDLVFTDWSIDPERMIGKGKLLDASHVSPGPIQLVDVKRQLDIESGDFVLFRTDWSRFAASERYHDHPELSLEIVEWLVERRINAVGIDAPGLGRGLKHGEYDRLLVKNGIFVIENLDNLATVPLREFRVYCLPLKIADTDAIPARVLVEIDDAGRNSDLVEA
jgi:kynurenine formamidase